MLQCLGSGCFSLLPLLKHLKGTWHFTFFVWRVLYSEAYCCSDVQPVSGEQFETVTSILIQHFLIFSSLGKQTLKMLLKRGCYFF